MSRIHISFWKPACLAGILLACIGNGCSRRHQMNQAEIESKLNGVLQQMVSRCADPHDQEALRAAQVFHKLQGLSMDIVGISVPVSSGSNHAHISFTSDHFQKSPVETLAA